MAVSASLLDFDAPPDQNQQTSLQHPVPATIAGPASTAPAAGFGEEPELPPTWSEHSRIFHTTEKCTRLQAIRPNRRVSGKPGLREHCLNCIDITATKRRG